MTPENRLKRLNALLEEFEKKGYKTYASLEKQYGVNASWISQLVNEKRSFGEKSARKMEEQFGLEPFYFDTVDDESLPSDMLKILEKGSVGITDEAAENELRVPIYNVYFCCGEGNDAHFDFEEIKGYHTLEENFFISRGIKPENFKMVCAVNDSMAPYINHGDEVGIVINDREVRDGVVYAILLDGDRMFKQIFREAGGALRLHSFNPAYPDKIVTAENHESLIIVGRQEYRAG